MDIKKTLTVASLGLVAFSSTFGAAYMSAESPHLVFAAGTTNTQQVVKPKLLAVATTRAEKLGIIKANELYTAEVELEAKQKATEEIQPVIEYFTNNYESARTDFSDLAGQIENIEALTSGEIASLNQTLTDANAKIEEEIKQIEAEKEAERKREEEQANRVRQASNNYSVAPAETNVDTANGKQITVSATAYGGDCIGCSGITATGIQLSPGMKVIAVDPNVIPLGSQVYVPGYGVAVAGDTGGAIKGNKIDLYMGYEANCAGFGRQNITVTVL